MDATTFETTLPKLSCPDCADALEAHIFKMGAALYKASNALCNALPPIKRLGGIIQGTIKKSPLPAKKTA